VITQANPSCVANLQQLLSRREHQAFLDELLLALDDADPTQLDYLRALGGEGLHALLQGEDLPIHLGRYADLLLSRKIHAPANMVRVLSQRLPWPELVAFSEQLTRTNTAERGSRQAHTNHVSLSQPPIQLKRVIQILDMGFANYEASDSLGIKRSVFRSERERKFLQALALRFPGLHAFPNYPLDQLVDFEKLRTLLDAETFQYGRSCRIDAVLVVPGEGDPVAAFDLDNRQDDDPDKARRDLLRNRIFRVVQIPFFRLRAEQCNSVGVDEWYALLTDEVASKIDCGNRLRIRSTHSTLVPV
jgi:hypothetical protein